MVNYGTEQIVKEAFYTIFKIKTLGFHFPPFLMEIFLISAIKNILIFKVSYHI